MKQKILVTIGDSWTEGVGCYSGDAPKMYVDTNIKFIEDPLEVVKFSNQFKDNFHKLGWPNRVGKKLGFDKVYNLGFAGSSNSASIKSFYNFLDNINLENSEVLVIWMMTDPSRFSFYIDGELKDYLPNTSYEDSFSKEYLNEIVDIHKDTILEQIFYIKTLEKICELNGFDLILSTWSRTITGLMEMYPSKNYLFSSPKTLRPPYIKVDNNEFFKYHSFCYHPNEEGYEWISNKIVEGIKENHNKWFTTNFNKDIEWEWCPSREWIFNKRIL